MNHQPNTPASLNEAVAGGTPGPWSVSADGRDVITDYRDALGNKTPDNWTRGGYAKVIARLEVTAWRNELQRKADAKRIAALAAPGAATDAREQEPPFITAMIDARRARYALDQSCTPAFLHWLDTIAPREGVAANEAWNAGYAEGLASREEAPFEQEDGYASAFYELGKLMGIPAQPISPERVWREQMLPTLQKALGAVASREAVAGWTVTKTDDGDFLLKNGSLGHVICRCDDKHMFKFLFKFLAVVAARQGGAA